jgi:hypothetical protein
MVQGEKIADCYCCFRNSKDTKLFEVGIFEDKTIRGTVYKCGLGFESCSLLKTYNDRPDSAKSKEEMERMVRKMIIEIVQTPKKKRPENEMGPPPLMA